MLFSWVIRQYRLRHRAERSILLGSLLNPLIFTKTLFSGTCGWLFFSEYVFSHSKLLCRRHDSNERQIKCLEFAGAPSKWVCIGNELIRSHWNRKGSLSTSVHFGPPYLYIHSGIRITFFHSIHPFGFFFVIDIDKPRQNHLEYWEMMQLCENGCRHLH